MEANILNDSYYNCIDVLYCKYKIEVGWLVGGRWKEGRKETKQ